MKALSTMGVNSSFPPITIFKMKKYLFLFMLLFLISFTSAGFGIDSSEIPTLKPDELIIIEGANYSINVNNTDHLEGRDTATLYTYFQGLFDSVYCQLTGCTMAGDIDMGGNDITNVGVLNATTINANISGNSNDKRTATLIVAASNSLNKEGADYICDGVADDVQIQAAIDLADSIGGGEIRLLDGLYQGNSSISLDGKKNIHLSGLKDSTIINLSTINLINSADVTISGIKFSNSGVNSITIINNTNSLIKENQFTSVTRASIITLPFGSGNINLRIKGNKFIGVPVAMENTIEGLSSILTDNFIVCEGTSATYSQSIGLVITDSNTFIGNNQIINCTTGLMFFGGEGNILSGNVISGETYGIYLDWSLIPEGNHGTNNSIIYGNTLSNIWNNGQNNTFFGNTGELLEKAGASGTVIQGASISGDSNVQTGLTVLGNINMTEGNITNVNDPTNPQDVATKNYVDNIASAIAFDFFFTNHTSDITGHYNFSETDEGHPETSLTSASLATGSNSVFNFTTEIGQPEFNILREGVYDARLHLFKTGTKSVTITPMLYNMSSDGSVKNLLLTFETSIELTTVDATYDLHGVLAEEVVLADGERLHMEFTAEVGASGSAPTVTLDMEGTTDTHMSIETSSNAFEAIFLRQDGTTPLTSNWDAVKNITATALGSLVNRIKYIFVEEINVNGTITLNGTAIDDWSDVNVSGGAGDNSSWNQSFGDDLYVNVAGDTMTGDLNMSDNLLTDVGGVNGTVGMDIYIRSAQGVIIHAQDGSDVDITGGGLDMNNKNITNVTGYMLNGTMINDWSSVNGSSGGGNSSWNQSLADTLYGGEPQFANRINFTDETMSIRTGQDYVDGYFNCDGNDYVDVSVVGNDILTSIGTISLWTNRTAAASGNDFIFGHYNSGNRLYIFNSNDRFYTGLGDDGVIDSGVALPLNDWIHLVVTWDSGDYAMYVNGSKVKNGTYTGLSAIGSKLGLCAVYVSSWGSYYTGLVDEVMVFNTSVSASTISNIYGLGRNLGSYTNESLVSHYRADGDAGDDKELNDGTLVGATVVYDLLGGFFEFKRGESYARVKADDYLYGSPYYVGDAKEDLKTMEGTGIEKDGWKEVLLESFPEGWLVYDDAGNPHLSLIGGLQWTFRLLQQHDEEIETLKVEVTNLDKRLEALEKK